MISCLGVRPIDQFFSRDTTLLREWLLKKGLSKSSLQNISWEDSLNIKSLELVP